jgi:hypothetical protein
VGTEAEHTVLILVSEIFKCSITVCLLLNGTKAVHYEFKLHVTKWLVFFLWAVVRVHNNFCIP